MAQSHRNNRGPVIRKARLGDARDIAALATQLGYPSTSRKITARLSLLLKDRGHEVLVSQTAAGEVVGWVHVFARKLVESDPHAEIGGLVVDRRFRGGGLGSRLLERAEQWARKKALPWVYLRSNVIRKGAHAFYERRGYKNVKTQHAYRKGLTKAGPLRNG
jgi:GNAT superfamily N-acetyltransferase